MALAGTWSCQGRTQYCELLTCVLVSPSPHVSIDEAVDKDEDMKYKKGQDGVGIITFQISEIVEKLFFHLIWNTLKCPRTIFRNDQFIDN